MPAIVYPPTLPAPSVATLVPTERRDLSSVAGPRRQQQRERDFNAQQSLVWAVMTREEIAVLRAWWHDDLYEGAAWFAARWPLPEGFIVGVRKFIAEPTRTYLKNGRWRVSAQCEVRGRGELPFSPDRTIIFTSWLYPFVVPEAFRPGIGVPITGHLVVPPNDDLALEIAVPIAGEVEQILVTYDDAAPDLLSVPPAIPLSGEVETILVVYDDAAPDQVEMGVAQPLSGALEDVLRTYANAVPDGVSFGISVPLSGVLS